MGPSVERAEERREFSKPTTMAVFRRVVVELLAVIGAAAAFTVCGYVCIRRLINHRGESAPPSSASRPAHDRGEESAWRDRGQSLCIAGHSALGALAWDAIEACEPGEAGAVRRQWLTGVIERARKTGEEATNLAARAATPGGRHTAGQLATAMADLAEAAEALLVEAAEARLHEPGAEVKRKALEDARGRVETALAALQTLAADPGD
ncbi:hypothetical protein GCM10010106_46190 [Thermopolyspora flexuosa]|uniref:Uncharacterized protein n=1 Tax=Thermopolyspora flexuosa TaxID=103836 RepID=A0A543IWS1_9ACTN|nr:hypothetical protein FHX40_1716 [Thermopolyspora flexuosa]GGM92750.1 hypothetical protein GCM10010106_46190 [Thermopolyspora flexuosa]